MTLIHRGRPPTSSREILQDAAFELFLENSYPKTTVDQIAQRAGGEPRDILQLLPHEE
jgi:AcrR family transcriptional regulator